MANRTPSPRSLSSRSAPAGSSRTISSRRIVLLLVVTAVAMMTIDARGAGPFQSVRGAAYTVTSPLRSVVGFVLSPVADAWQGIVHYDDLAQENDELRQRVAELEGVVDRLPDREAELEELKIGTDIDFVESLPTIAASVTADRRTSVERIIEIDRGSADGVREGMPVVTGDGLVGRIVLVTSGTSQVQLISDPRTSIGVVSKGTRAIGVTTGDGDGIALLVDLEEGATEIVAPGSRFETSGLNSSDYPGGIPVGRLVIENGRTRIEPLADLDRLAFVSVILTEEPS